MISQIAHSLYPLSSQSMWGGISRAIPSTVMKVASLALGAALLYSFWMGAQGGAESPINLCEYGNVAPNFCRGHLGIPRSLMPQLEGQVKDYFLEENFAACSLFNPQNVSSTQSEVNLEKVSEIVASAIGGVFNPCYDGIITANGDYGNVRVVDGHHRAAACYELARLGWMGAKHILAHHIAKPIADVIAYANAFEGVVQYDLSYFEK